MITALAGGVGAARFLVGLAAVMPPDEITAIVNTGDDVRMHGLWISPDLDTVTYTLAGAINGATGWGLEGETWSAMGALARYAPVRPVGSRAGETWFGLGDKDLATHMYRTARLAEGASLTEVTAEIAGAWGVSVSLRPMTDQPVPTMVTVDSGEIGFQEYFVGQRHAVPVRSLRFFGADACVPAPGVMPALSAASLVIICPSNPFVSIGPILAVPGVRSGLSTRRSSVVAISPIVAGAALKGPADQMMASLGHEVSVVGVARLYAPIAGTLVIDTADAALASRVEQAGMRCVVTPTVMHGPAEAARLASTVLA